LKSNNILFRGGPNNPVVALLEFKPNFYDLLLVDINMPHMNGSTVKQQKGQIDVLFANAGVIELVPFLYKGLELCTWVSLLLVKPMNIMLMIDAKMTNDTNNRKWKFPGVPRSVP
jgi:hypothetical protein